MLTEIKGQIERITFYNEENSYTIAKMRVQGRNDLVTIVGGLPGITPGEVLQLRGEWQTHPRYGEQFKITSYESIIPATIAGIERYLSSGLIKGIGPVMAQRLVAKFGEETLDVISHDIERLREVEGFADKRIEMIKKAWEEQKEIRQVMVFLQGYGVSPAYATKIFKQYGREAIAVVRENPYRLAEEVFGIGFLTADKIAEKLGISKDSPLRAKAGIQHVLHQLSDEGHTFYPFKPLMVECAKILGIEEATLLDAFEAAAAERKIVIEEREESAVGDKAVYLTPLHVAEVGAARILNALLTSPKQLQLMDREGALKAAQKDLSITLAEQQLKAVMEALDRKVMVITGGPGTGKTTIIRAITHVYAKSGQKIVLAAPTGRAAKRMFEATGREAKTIHRLLEFSPKIGKFKRDEQEPLDADLVVIDETSMVDTVLMHNLLKAIPQRATLILVGDVDQLPSVGPGNVIRDIIDSNVVPTIRFNEIFRQARQSAIIVNAHRVNSGQMPDFDGQQEAPTDFYFIEVEEPEKALQRIIALCKEKIPARFGFNSLNDIQVLTPMHKGTVGASNLNAELQRELNPSKDEIARAGRTFKKGDKVMQIRNNYDKDVYNGDIGRIAAINREEQEVSVNFDGRPVAYEFSELDELVLAYATSIHKAQGSEYPVVIIPILIQHFVLLQRNLLYTGITRGKKLVIIIGTKKALAIAIHNNKPRMRYTLLKERLMKRL
ncbi:MAG: ATP-dependent RecD-like DNA helicase [Syntrophorhabdales bacterium]|jgi:exodeoxyribonuclease V alpha subunit